MITNAIVACVPVGSQEKYGIPYTPQPGYEEAICPLCEEGMWLGPKSKRQLDNAVAVCMPCAVTHLGLNEKTKIACLGDVDE